MRAKRCRHCGYQRFYPDKERARRKACHRAGYHHAHRPGSRCCEHHPMHMLHQAQRAGHDVQELELELVLAGKGKSYASGVIPF